MHRACARACKSTQQLEEVAVLLPEPCEGKAGCRVEKARGACPLIPRPRPVRFNFDQIVDQHLQRAVELQARVQDEDSAAFRDEEVANRSCHMLEVHLGSDVAARGAECVQQWRWQLLSRPLQAVRVPVGLLQLLARLYDAARGHGLLEGNIVVVVAGVPPS